MRLTVALCALPFVFVSWAAGCADAATTETDTNDAETPDVVPDVASDTPSDAAPDAPEVTAPAGAWWEDCPADTREQRFIDVGEVTLNVACRGAGPTVVFLHGFPEFHGGWGKVMDELAGEYRLVAPDQRGYNTSDKPEGVEAYELPLLVDDILALLPLVSADPVILVAHDWGGAVGWLVAHSPEAHLRGFIAANGPHPMRFTQLIATDEAQQDAAQYMTLFKSALAEDFLTVDYLGGLFDGLLDEAELAEYEAAWTQPGAITGGLNWSRANALEIEPVTALMAGYAAKVEVPTTVMWGLADEQLLPPNAEGLDAYVTDLKVETFPGVDHWIDHRIPEEIARAVRELDARAAFTRR